MMARLLGEWAVHGGPLTRTGGLGGDGRGWAAQLRQSQVDAGGRRGLILGQLVSGCLQTDLQLLHLTRPIAVWRPRRCALPPESADLRRASGPDGRRTGSRRVSLRRFHPEAVFNDDGL